MNTCTKPSLSHTYITLNYMTFDKTASTYRLLGAAASLVVGLVSPETASKALEHFETP